MFKPVLSVVAAAAFLIATNVAAAAGDAAAGEKIFTGKCTACHAPDANRVGPMLRGVVGRKSGTAEGYNYSTAVKALNVTWDDATLDKWLTNPGAMATGTRMMLHLDKPEDRASIIAYLKTLTAKK